MRCIRLPKGTTYTILFYDVVSLNDWNLIKIVTAVFEKIAFFVKAIWRAPTFAAEVFIFTAYRLIVDTDLISNMDKILSSVHELTRRNPYRETAQQKPFFHNQGAENV
jgi:hypothetical protein